MHRLRRGCGEAQAGPRKGWRSVKKKETDLLQGTLDLLILRALSHGPKHGFGVVKSLQDASHNVFRVGEGSLYPALQRLEQKGMVVSEWGRTDENRRARFYKITELGELQLERETQRWRKYSVAVELVLQMG